MKIKLYLISVLFLFLFSLTTSASSIKLSKDATISILTCSPGNELYSLFGHTGIRVIDKANNLDIVFNYGTFDFQTQGFYFKFAQGLLPYKLACSEFRYFLPSYKEEKRSVYSQTLNLDSIQKQYLMDLLLKNAVIDFFIHGRIPPVKAHIRPVSADLSSDKQPLHRKRSAQGYL